MSLLRAAFLTLAVFALSCSGSDGDTGARPSETEAPGLPSAGAPAGSIETPAAALGTIDWYDCGVTGFECGEFVVPLDYDDPGAGTISLAVRRMPAGDPEARLGVLFANPGGPGGSAIGILSGWSRSLPETLRDRFDIVLFDPRGVGQSSPLVCAPDHQAMIGLDPYPDTEAEWQTLESVARELSDACGREGGDVLAHLGTVNVARDMDRLREALGEETISYFGYSYGTTLGQTYAELFPQHVRAMVLDGAVDVTLPSDDRTLEQTLGFEAAFQRYLADCASWGCLPGDPATTIRTLIQRAATNPIPAPHSDRPAGPGELYLALAGSLYNPASWMILTASLNGALNGDASGIILIADTFAGRGLDGTYSNQLEANIAVNCVDFENEREPASYRQQSEAFAEQAPYFGTSASVAGLMCALWPAETSPLPAPRAAGAPPIIVIGTTGDPATPYKWAVSLAGQLESGVLLTRDGEGHLAYRMGNGCIDSAVNAYLIDLQTPVPGTVCGEAGIEPAPPIR